MEQELDRVSSIHLCAYVLQLDPLTHSVNEGKKEGKENEGTHPQIPGKEEEGTSCPPSLHERNGQGTWCAPSLSLLQG